MANTDVTANAVNKLWEDELFLDMEDHSYFKNKGLIGTEKNNIIQVKKDFVGKKGDRLTLPITLKLSGDGVDGDDEMEGNEEAIAGHTDQISLNKKRFAVRLEGTLAEKKAAYNMRMDAKEKLAMRMNEFKEMQFFLKAGSVTNVTITNVANVIIAASCSWSNTPDYVPDADTAAGVGDRYICANSSGAASLSTADLLTPDLISRAKIKAQLANPKLIPLRIKGVDHFVMFIHPWQAYDLRNNAIFHQAMREAEKRGSENPIFTGALGIWNNVVILEHEYVPFLDIAGGLGGGHSFRGAAAGTDFSADTFRALLCGRQAVIMLDANYKNKWVEETKDYKDKVGFSTGVMGGYQKTQFNNKDYGVIAVDTYATHL